MRPFYWKRIMTNTLMCLSAASFLLGTAIFSHLKAFRVFSLLSVSNSYYSYLQDFCPSSFVPVAAKDLINKQLFSVSIPISHSLISRTFLLFHAHLRLPNNSTQHQCVFQSTEFFAAPSYYPDTYRTFGDWPFIGLQSHNLLLFTSLSKLLKLQIMASIP